MDSISTPAHATPTQADIAQWPRYTGYQAKLPILSKTTSNHPNPPSQWPRYTGYQAKLPILSKTTQIHLHSGPDTPGIKQNYLSSQKPPQSTFTVAQIHRVSSKITYPLKNHLKPPKSTFTVAQIHRVSSKITYLSYLMLL